VRCDERVLPFVLGALEDSAELGVYFFACPPLPAEYSSEDQTCAATARHFVNGGSVATAPNATLMRAIARSFRAGTLYPCKSDLQGHMKGLRLRTSAPRPLQDRLDVFAIQAPFPADLGEATARFQALHAQDVFMARRRGILGAVSKKPKKSRTISPVASPPFAARGALSRQASASDAICDEPTAAATRGGGGEGDEEEVVSAAAGEERGRRTGPRSSKLLTDIVLEKVGLQSQGFDQKSWSEISCKVVDLGNACFRSEHYSDDIQTRQYRCPEVIIQAGYDTSSDIWSMACVIFELATGDLLFDPKPGAEFDRDEDHLALMVELLGDIPKSFALSGKDSRKFFNRKAKLKRIQNLKYWCLKDVLIQKYSFKEKHAEDFAEFLQSMLAFKPEDRITAKEALEHEWLRTVYSSIEEDSEREEGKAGKDTDANDDEDGEEDEEEDGDDDDDDDDDNDDDDD
jgi:hypothetical protein